MAGTVGTSLVGITPLSGFNGSVALSAGVLPPGVTVTFTPPTISGSGSSTMTATVPAGTLPGTQPVTITAASGSIIHTATLNLAIPDFSVSAMPATRNVIAGGNVTYTITASAPAGSPGSVSYAAIGLPAGLSAAFSPAPAQFNSPVMMTITAAGGAVAGSYPFVVTATNGTLNHSTSVTVVVTPALSGGALSGFMTSPSGTVQLTTAGTFDWAHWGLNTITDFDHKASGAQQISDITLVGGGNLHRYANNSVAFTWTDGTPTPSVTNSKTGVYSLGQGTGFSITVPADPTPRTLTVYVGAFQAQGRMVARLSDGSAPDYVDTSLINTVGVTTLGAYTFAYSAASSGQTLTVTFIQDSATLGNVTLQAATLSGGPDFSVNASPSSRTVLPGGGAAYTVNVSALNGFSGSVAFTANGLPPGATGTFSPATVTTAGSTTLTVNTNAGVIPGTYPVTITAANGLLVHTAPVTLSVTTPATGGVLSGSMAAPTGPVQLTLEGSSDWAHWGFAAATDFNHKAAVTQQISNIATVGPNTPARYANNSVGYTWTDGTPVSSATNSTTGVFVSGQGNGFQISAPADTTPRTLKIYVGAWRTQGQFVAHLSDGSAADYVDTSLTNSAGVTTLGMYTLTYAAASSGQTLTVTYTQQTATGGNVAIQAASLSNGTAAPDFSVSVTPASQSVAAGNGAVYTVSVVALNGFSGSTGFTVAGLPAGLSASFSPATVTNTGSSTMTVNAPAGTSPGTYPFTVTAFSGALSHTTNVSLTVTAPADFTVNSNPLTRSVAAGGSAPYTLTVAALNGFAGNVAFGITGLPSGITAGFNPATVTGSGNSVLTLTSTAGTVPGTYPLVVTAGSGGLSHTVNITLTVTAPLTGTLSGSLGAPANPVQLTAEGSTDWAHWGLNASTDFDHKAGVTPQISNYTMLAAGSPARYANNAVGFTWTDGTPNAAAANSTTGIYISGQNGFQLTLPADTATRTLKLYVGIWRTQGRLVAHLSDGSAVDYVDTSLSNSAGVTTLGVYALNYSAGSPGQTLTVTFSNTSTSGNATLQAATLSGGIATSDFTVGATPGSQSLAPGSNATYTVNTSAVNGFAGNVGFTMSGLPSGITADFNPGAITAGGSSTLTLTTTSGTAPGTYPLTITATSGSLSHTSNITLVVTAAPDFTISTIPASQSVVAGSNAGYPVTITAQNGFAASVAFTMSALPPGVTAAFAPGTVTGSGGSTLTLSTRQRNRSRHLSFDNHRDQWSSEPHIKHHADRHSATRFRIGRNTHRPERGGRL